jgi:NADP-dependent 3-hydroxy acid dehydrogenase YdfG
MKVAITGHTKGIGKALAEYFQNQGHTVLGYSRSNGFDISLEDIRNTIIEQLDSCDVFINNAYVPLAQTDLLIKTIELWGNTTKIIVNINSKSTLMPYYPEDLKEYVDDKRQQQKIIKDRVFKARPYIMNFTPGLVDTEMSNRFKSRKLDPNHIAKLIYTLLEFKNEVAVQEILIEVPDLDWNDIARI